MSVIVTFPSKDGYEEAVEVLAGQLVLETSMPLSLAVSDLTYCFRINPDWNISAKDFRKYLNVHQQHTSRKTVNIKDTWKSMIEDAVKAMRVAVILNDEITCDQCIDILHEVCYCLFDESTAMGYGCCFVLLLAIMRTCEDYKSVIVDVLSQMPVAMIADLLGDSAHPMNTPFCWAATEFTPEFERGNLFGIDLHPIMNSAIRNVVKRNEMDSASIVIAKYCTSSPDTEITFEDACDFVTGVGCNPEIFNSVASAIDNRNEIMNQICAIEDACANFVSIGFINNKSLSRLMFNRRLVKKLGDRHFMRIFQIHSFDQRLSTMFPAIHATLGNLGLLKGDRYHTAIKLWQTAILAELYSYFADRDQLDIAEEYYVDDDTDNDYDNDRDWY